MKSKQLILTSLMVGSILCSVINPHMSVAASQKDVLATVGNESITVSDLQDRILTFPAQFQPNLQAKEAKEKILEQLIQERIIVLAAKKSGIQNTASYKSQVQSTQTQLLIATYIRNNIDSKTGVSDDEATDYFQKNPDQFKESELRQARHILVKTDVEAADIISKLRNGADFAALAKEKSLDTGSAANGGDLGSFGKGQMVPEFEQAVYALQKGQVSGAVKTQFGFHVIKLDGITVRPKAEFAQVKEQIRDTLVNEKKRILVTEELDGLKKIFKVKKDSRKL